MIPTQCDSDKIRFQSDSIPIQFDLIVHGVHRVYIKKKPVYHPPAYSEYAKAAAAAAASEKVETKVPAPVQH